MFHYLVDLFTDGSSRGPAIPKGVGFLLLASPGTEAPWALYRVSEPLSLSSKIRQVPPELEAALVSAYRYPPALAIARDQIRGEFGGSTPSEAAFCDRFAELIRAQMNVQGNTPYLFVEAVGAESGYLTPGQYYWVLRYLRGSDTVIWVSSDYFLYQNSRSDFRLGAEDLDRLLLPAPPFDALQTRI